MSVGGFSSSSTQRQLVSSFEHSSLFALASVFWKSEKVFRVCLVKLFELQTSAVRSSFPCDLSCLQEEPHRGLQGWLGGGWSLALAALPGSPQVPGKVIRVTYGQKIVIFLLPRSCNPQLLPALGLLGPQIGLRTVFLVRFSSNQSYLQAAHRRCLRNHQTEKLKIKLV